MHESVMRWLQAKVKQYDLNRPNIKVLEIGSYNVNGSARSLLDQTDYWGIDFVAGPGVDEVLDKAWGIKDINQRWHQYDLIISTEQLEHDPMPWVTISSFYGLLKPKGLALVTARGFSLGRNNQVITCYGYHAEAHFKDYWRFSQDGVRALCDLAMLRIKELVMDSDLNSPGFFLVAQAP